MGKLFSSQICLDGSDSYWQPVYPWVTLNISWHLTKGHQACQYWAFHHTLDSADARCFSWSMHALRLGPSSDPLASCQKRRWTEIHEAQRAVSLPALSLKLTRDWRHISLSKENIIKLYYISNWSQDFNLYNFTRCFWFLMVCTAPSFKQDKFITCSLSTLV